VCGCLSRSTSASTAWKGVNLSAFAPPLATVTLNGTLDRVLVVPGFHAGQTRDAVAQLILPSGKGLNVARTAHVLGSDVLATGLIAGQCGQQIRALLHQAHIPERFLWLAEGESRTATILVDPEARQTTVVHDGGLILPPGLWPQIRGHVRDAVSGYRWVALCGSCAAGLPDSAYAELCADLQSRGQHACLDTRDAWLASALDARPDLVKCNQHEAARVQGCPVETPVQAAEAAQRWVSRGTAQVVITLGAQGAVAASAAGAWHVTAPRIDPLSPIGSGDAMMAGLVLALGRGQALAEATRFGVAVGTANALRLGAGCCDLDALPALLRDTHVTQTGSPSSGHAAPQDGRG
jgi:1-phosphofructokinase family hexose kinase